MSALASVVLAAVLWSSLATASPGHEPTHWTLGVVALEAPTENGSHFNVWLGFRNVGKEPRLLCRATSGYSVWNASGLFDMGLDTPSGSDCGESNRAYGAFVLPGQTLYVPKQMSVREGSDRFRPDFRIHVFESIVQSTLVQRRATTISLEWTGTIAEALGVGRQLLATRKRKPASAR